MRPRRRRHRALLLAAVAVLAVPVPGVRAAWSDILPKPFENGIAVELFGSHERERDQGSGDEFGWTDTFFREEVELFSNGYIYHPRFLLYRLSLSGALKQEDYSPLDAADTGWVSGTGVEYDARYVFKPIED